MVNILKLLLQHIKEYCEAAAIHGPQHIVSRNLTRLERLVSYRYVDVQGLHQLQAQH